MRRPRYRPNSNKKKAATRANKDARLLASSIKARRRISGEAGPQQKAQRTQTMEDAKIVARASWEHFSRAMSEESYDAGFTGRIELINGYFQKTMMGECIDPMTGTMYLALACAETLHLYHWWFANYGAYVLDSTRKKL